MKPILPLFLIFLVAPLATACVSMGPNYDPAAVARLRPGMDRSEVTAMLGRPSTAVTLSDGTQHLMWVHSRGTMLGTAEARSLTLIFGPDGKYLRTFSQAETSIR